MSGSFRDLQAWRKAIDLVGDIYALTRSFPREEMFGLSAQLRRAAVSVASNIAEGKGRSSDKEFSLFLHHARGSLCEIETQMVLAEKLGYASEKQAISLERSAGELARMINGLIKAVGPGRVMPVLADD
jgi:four helix bundle protein